MGVSVFVTVHLFIEIRAHHGDGKIPLSLFFSSQSQSIMDSDKNTHTSCVGVHKSFLRIFLKCKNEVFDF
jgi:hypothetical protein